MIKKSVHTTTRYVVNGREYPSLDAMPEEIRKLFVDQNANGIPDAIEDDLRRMGVDPATVKTTETRTEQVTIRSHLVGRDPTSRILERADEEAPPLPDEIRRDAQPGFSLTLGLRQLLWIALLLGLTIALLWSWLR